MKTILKSVLCLTTLGIFLFGTACQNTEKKIQKQAEKFLNAYYGGDYKEAKVLSAYVTHSLIEQREYKQSLNPYSKEDQSVKFRITAVQIRPTKTEADVSYWMNEKEHRLVLVNDHGTWLVKMDSDDPIETGSSFTNRQVDGGGVASAESEPIRISDVK